MFAGPPPALRLLAVVAALAAILWLATEPGDSPPAANQALAAGEDKIFEELQAQIENVPLDQRFPVIVLLDEPLSSASLGVLRSRVGSFDTTFQYPSVNGFAATLSKGQILALAQLQQVRQIEQDALVRPALDKATLWFGVNKARDDFGLDGNTDGSPTYSKDDIVIAVLDTGINAAHVDLDGGKVIGWADFIDSEPSPYDQGDDCGYHGTHVSSIAAGEGQGDSAFKGVAPGAALVGVKVLGLQDPFQDCVGTVSQVNAGIQWVIDNKATYNINIMNMSLGASGCSDGQDSQSLLVNSAVASGITATVAAGNEGPNLCTIGTPGAAEDAITVAAISDVEPGPAVRFNCDSNFVSGGFRLACFSSRGPTHDSRIKPDIAAPGVQITAADGAGANGYVSLSGTSMATPFVAGVAALMLQADPSLTPAQIKTVLMDTAVDWGPDGKDIDYGAGRLDAYEAIRTAAGGIGDNIDVPNHETVQAVLAAAGQPGDSVSYDIHVADSANPLAVTLIMPTWSSALDFDMELLDKDGVRVRRSQTTLRQETIGIAFPTNGPYTLRVYAFAGGSFSSIGGPFFFDLSVAGGIDSDGDTIIDSLDNCPQAPNPGQEDFDSDGVGDACDVCPAWPNPGQDLPPWPVPADDPDCDGWTTAHELLIGTDPIAACGPGAWPPDLNDDGVVNILDLSLLAPPTFGSSEGNPAYSIRKDISPDGVINILDITRMAPPIFGATCS